MGRATPAPGQRGELERGRLNLTPLLWGGSAPRGKDRRYNPATSTPPVPSQQSTNCAQREGGSCVNPRCLPGLLGFCLSNARRLCCLQSLCAATVIAALCLAQAALLGFSLLGRFQVTVTYSGKCSSNLLFPCHEKTDTEINGDVSCLSELLTALAVPGCSDAVHAPHTEGTVQGHCLTASKTQTKNSLTVFSRGAATAGILDLGFVYSS